jgi:hypothetical protein
LGHGLISVVISITAQDNQASILTRRANHAHLRDDNLQLLKVLSLYREKTGTLSGKKRLYAGCLDEASALSALLFNFEFEF